ncbi:MAG: tripartite tricarboxylate transporter TctB family protein [Pseudolabrys sp.]|nr:tripartite tricarboxylate transporter TctB family protein [Pseudolabrys sp.]
MILRADHVAGAAFVIFGVTVIALSGDLPTGQLSMPGSGFLPKIVSVLTIMFGAALMLRARESAPFAELGWSDGAHALAVTGITATGILLYTVLGFIATLILMIMALLIIIERRNPFRAAAYAAGVVLATYAAFSFILKTPLPGGIFGP